MPPSAPLKILVAGVDKDARGPVEATVRRAFGARSAAEPWSVSLVRLGETWSVTLSGPGERFRHVSFSATDRRLAEAIGEVIGDAVEGPAPGLASPGAPARAPVHERHACGRCQKGILVTYEAQPDEPRELVPLACPHCWTVSHVEIGAWAAVGGDYRAEKA